MEPLREELRAVAASAAPLHDARRLLEVLVPLAYRPAIKAALLDADVLPVLADILGGLGLGFLGYGLKLIQNSAS